MVAALAAQGWLLGAGWGPDGAALVRDHPSVGKGVAAVGELFAPDAWPEAQGTRPWRPLALTGLGVQVSAFEGGDGRVDPQGFRVVTLLLHALAGILLLGVLDRFLGPGRPGIALAATLLFVVHPVVAPALGAMAGQAGVLALCLALVAAWLFDEGVRGGRPACLPLAALAFFLALSCKESVIGLPVLLWALGGLDGEDGAPRPARLFGLVLLVLVAGVFLGLSPASPLTPGPLALEGVARSAAAVLLPLGLVRDLAEIASPGVGWSPGATVGLLLAVVAAVLVGARVLLGRRPGPVAAGFVAFVGLALPGALLSPVGEVLGAGFAYPVSVGLFLLLGRGVVAILPSRSGARPVGALGAVGAGLLVLALGTLSWREGAAWQSGSAWHASLVARHPLRRDLALREVRYLRREAGVAREGLQTLAPDSPAYQEGLARFRALLARARGRVGPLVRRDPADPVARSALGALELMAGQAPEAERTLERALGLDPLLVVGESGTLEPLDPHAEGLAERAPTALLLGEARDVQGRFEEGLEGYRLAVSLAPYDPVVLLRAARALARAPQHSVEALALLDRAVGAERAASARARLRTVQAGIRRRQRDAADRAMRRGHRLEAGREYREAARAYDEALRVDPQRIEAWLQLAWIRGEYLGEYPAAEAILDGARRVVDAAGGRGAGPARAKIRAQRDALEKARLEDEAEERALMGEDR